MKYNSINSRCPVIRTGPNRIARIIDASEGLGLYQAVTFDCSVVWLRESSTKTVIRHGQSIRDTGSRYSDFYGYLTSLREPLSEARAICEREDITETSRRELAIVVTITDVPVIRNKTDRGYPGIPSYYQVPRDWIDADAAEITRWTAASREERCDIALPHIISVEHGEFDVFNSRWPTETRRTKAVSAVESALTKLPNELAQTVRASLDETFADGL